jgi:hypothetical protein
VDWLLFTDDHTNYDYPDNVKVKYFTFDEIVKVIQSKLGSDVIVPRPYKLCDYKPAYGAIFEDYLSKYDFWGFGDMDLIFGNIRFFLTDEILNSHDRIFTHGSFSLLKNTSHFSQLFRNKINGISKFEEVSKNSKSYGFDEYGANNFYPICVSQNLRIFKDNLCFADINSWRQHFELTGVMFLCNEEEKKQLIWEKATSSSNSAFLFDKGNLIRYYIKNNELCTKDYLYVHFQKRIMEYDNSLKLKDAFIMIPNKFVAKTTDIDVKYLQTYARKKIFSNRRIKRQLYIRTRMFIKRYLKI